MEFNPCFFGSSSIYPSTPDGAGASSSLNDNVKIRNLKTPLHTFSYLEFMARRENRDYSKTSFCLVSI